MHARRGGWLDAHVYKNILINMKMIMLPPLVRAVLVACALSVPGAATADVPTVRIGAQVQDLGFVSEASIEAVHQVTVAAQVQGRVLALSVDTGDRVRRGQVLARIDAAEAAAALAAAQAVVGQAEAEMGNARSELARARGLVERQFLSASALDAARTRLEAAEAAVKAARAQREQAAAVKGQFEIVAPLDGVVSARHIETGEMAQPGRALFTLHDPARMRAVTDVAPQRLAALGEGAVRARVTLGDGGRVVDAEAVTLLPAADARTHTVRVRVELPAGTDGLMPGSFARVHFVGAAGTAEASVVVVPRAAILRRGELTAVYVADGAGGFALRQVRLGRGVNGSEAVEVLAGLKGDETLALDPVQAGLRARVAAPAR